MPRETGARAGIGPYRRANLLDVTACTWPFLLPFFLPTILAAGTTGDGGGMPRLSPADAGLYNAYSWALVAMLACAVGLGYGRGEGPEPAPAAITTPGRSSRAWCAPPCPGGGPAR